MKRIVSIARSCAVAAGFVALVGGQAGAQQPAGSWQPWLGCWSAGPAIGGIAPSQVAPLVCVTPTVDANVVEVTTISGDKVVSTQRLDASGRELPVETKGCTGSQHAQWSADGRRVYLKAVTKCDGLDRVTSGIMAISPTGEWLDVQGVGVSGEEGVRVARYRDAGLPSVVPEQIAAALRGRSAAATSTRSMAGATIGSAAVIEASKAAAPAVVEAWILERGQAFGLDANELVRLADAGVPARVTDAMVAISNPQHFAVARPDDRARRRALDDEEITGRRIYVYMDPLYSPYRWGYSPYGYGYGYGPYGYSPLGYGGYGYGSGYYGYPGYLAPIVVVTPQTQTQRGQMVKGRGYTPSASSGTTTPTATPRPSSSSGSSSSGSSSSQPARSDPPASEPRTAHPRP
ncbi:MAG TPA: hypothetical protein VFI52_01300 [Gemmatimonadaceae bacterium]|nr:hypothetical protein [Gemmatimonadaceae bacterium]